MLARCLMLIIFRDLGKALDGNVSTAVPFIGHLQTYIFCDSK
jgi:hypothetical protein